MKKLIAVGLLSLALAGCEGSKQPISPVKSQLLTTGGGTVITIVVAVPGN